MIRYGRLLIARDWSVSLAGVENSKIERKNKEEIQEKENLINVHAAIRE